MNYQLPCSRIIMNALLELTQQQAKDFADTEGCLKKSKHIFTELANSDGKKESYEIKLGESALIANKWFIKYLGLDAGKHHFEIQEWVTRLSQTRIRFGECKNNSIIQLGEKLVLVVQNRNYILLFELN